MTNPRPSSTLNSITADSRFVQKIHDRIIELIDDTLLDALADGSIIDTNEPNWGSEEEHEKYKMLRSDAFTKLVLDALAR